MTEDQKRQFALDLLTANYLKQLISGIDAPKGVQHHHNAVISDLENILKMLPDTTEDKQNPKK